MLTLSTRSSYRPASILLPPLESLLRSSLPQSGSPSPRSLGSNVSFKVLDEEVERCNGRLFLLTGRLLIVALAPT